VENADPTSTTIYGNSLALVVGNTARPPNTIPGIIAIEGTGEAAFCCNGLNSSSAIENGGSGKLIPDPTWQGFTSDHPGGVQFVLGDGSVRFISENISMTTYQNLSTNQDGNPLGEF
jgi:hypothetical protein